VDEVSVIITDLKGFVLSNSKPQLRGDNSFEMDVAQLKPGAYFLRLQTKDGDKTFSFIKQ
ncbi:MAG: T9SS type A sorting domain-containing protein, partial [Parafilimonas sp.]